MTKKERDAMPVQVTTITITRARKVQPEQYGSADASITLVANVDEGSDWQSEARALLADTRKLVYENLGLKLPARAVEEAAKVDTPTETVKVETKPAANDNEPPKDEKPKRRGRPPKSAQAPAALAPDDDVPGDDDKPQIRTNPEDRKDPADDDIPDDGMTEAEAAATGPADDDVPDDSESTKGGAAAADADDLIGEYTVADLQGYLTNLVKDKKVSAQRVREIIASHGVARTSDLPADKVLLVKQAIDAAAAE